MLAAHHAPQPLTGHLAALVAMHRVLLGFIPESWRLGKPLGLLFCWPAGPEVPPQLGVCCCLVMAACFEPVRAVVGVVGVAELGLNLGDSLERA